MSTRELGPLKPLEMDALKEVGNIGAGHAATALSQMLGVTVRITVPEASIIRVQDIPRPLGGPEAVVAATYFRIFGQAPGRMLIFTTREVLPEVLLLLLGKRPRPDMPLLPEEESAIREMGNILCSAYLNALADLMGMQLLPSVPALAYDMVGSVLATVLAESAESQDKALLIETRFVEATRPITMYLFLIPESGALEPMLKSLENISGGVKKV